MKTYDMCENYVSNTEFIQSRSPIPTTRKCTCNIHNDEIVVSEKKQLIQSSDFYLVNDLNKLRRFTIRFPYKIFPKHINSFFIQVDSFKFILNDSDVNIENFNSNKITKNVVSNSLAMLHSDLMSEQTIWISFDENTIKFGHGFVMRENLLFVFTNLERNFSIDYVRIDPNVALVSPYVYLSLSSISTYVKSPFVKRDELTSEEKEKSVLMPDTLPKQAESVFFHLDGFNFDDYDLQAIHYSLKTKDCTLNEKFSSFSSSDFKFFLQS
jgi:hypothetical protein